MIVYHGGTQVITAPEIRTTDKGKDFGAGFYTTDIKEQAEKWAKRQRRVRKSNDAVINIYDYNNDDAQKILKIKKFEGYTPQWLDFVINNRQNTDYRHIYDIVTGKIANDDVGETIQAVIDGLAPRDFALSKLIYMPANNQICFCTPEALSFLTFIKSERL